MRESDSPQWPPALAPQPRRLLGPGPSNVHPRVQAAMTQPMLGHLDPQFVAIMGEVQRMLREVFCTENRLTLPVSGTGSAGMEAALVNLIEPGDEVLVCTAGYFALRMCDMVERMGGVLHKFEKPWGETFSTAEVEAALERHPRAELVAIVHGETSTGALQRLDELGRAVPRARPAAAGGRGGHTGRSRAAGRRLARSTPATAAARSACRRRRAWRR